MIDIIANCKACHAPSLSGVLTHFVNEVGYTFTI